MDLRTERERGNRTDDFASLGTTFDHRNLGSDRSKEFGRMDSFDVRTRSTRLPAIRTRSRLPELGTRSELSSLESRTAERKRPSEMRRF